MKDDFCISKNIVWFKEKQKRGDQFEAIVVIQIREVAGITRILQISDGRMVASSRISGTTVGIEIKMGRLKMYLGSRINEI